MTPRTQNRLIYGLAFLILAVVVIAVAYTVFQRELIIWALSPDASFAETTPPPAPDYSMLDTWAALPDRADTADLTPVGSVDAQAMAPADAFFIHPTTHLKGGVWNAAYDDPDAAASVDDRVMRYQASVFNGCCRVYAPRYRQASVYYTLAQDDPDSFKAVNLAYTDVKQAFEYYLANWNDGRPIVIASHSQGSRYALRLLADYFDKAPLKDRLVAAYVIGIGIPLDKFDGALTGIGPCRTATDTGCIVSWNTIGEGGSDARYAQQYIWYPTGPQRNGVKRRLCVNPLLWTGGNRVAPSSANLGSVVPIPGGVGLGAPVAALTGAQCRNGVLWIDDTHLPEPLKARVLPGKDYHVYDYSLFYMNLRQNARNRVEAFIARAQ